MKKLLLSLVLIIVSSFSASADEISITNLSTIQKNGEAVFNIALNSETKKYYGLQFDIAMAYKLSLSVNSDNTTPTYTKLNSISDFMSAATTVDDDYYYSCYRVLAYDTAKIASGTSNIISFTLKANTTPDGEYDVVLKNIIAVNSDYTDVSLKDATIKVTVSGSTISNIELDETSTSDPTVTSGSYYYTVNRTISSNTWSTIVLPFAMTPTEVQSAFGSNVEFAEVKDYSMGTIDEANLRASTINLNFTKYDYSINGIEANHPYLLKTDHAISSFTTLNKKEVTSYATQPSVNIANNDGYDQGQIYGTYKKITVPAGRLYLSSNVLGYSTGSSNMKGFRAYINLPYMLDAYFDADAEAKVNFLIDDKDVTAIDDLHINVQEINSKVYNLAGQYMGESLESLPAGVYIQSGKKICIK